MSYAKRPRPSRARQYKVERVHTAYGHLFLLLRFFGLKRLTLLLMRRPWHIADEYVNGRLVRPINLYPKKRLYDRVNKAAAKKLQQQ